jgi:hypothetical protein
MMLITSPQSTPITRHSITCLDQVVFDGIRNGELTLIDQSERLGYDQKIQFSIFNSHNHLETVIDFLIDDQGFIYADYCDYIIKYSDSDIDVKTALMKLFNSNDPRIVITWEDGMTINDPELYEGMIANKVPIRQYSLSQGDIYLN